MINTLSKKQKRYLYIGVIVVLLGAVFGLTYIMVAQEESLSDEEIENERMEAFLNRPEPIQPISSENGSLFNLLEKNPEYSLFVSALEHADMNLLKYPGSYTIFVPTNTAFEELPANMSVESLMQAENKGKLIDLLSYHIVLQKISSEDIQSTSTIEPLLRGEIISVSSNEQIILNGSSRISEERPVEVLNGKMYSIDSVLIPDSME